MTQTSRPTYHQQSPMKKNAKICLILILLNFWDLGLIQTNSICLKKKKLILRTNKRKRKKRKTKKKRRLVREGTITSFNNLLCKTNKHSLMMVIPSKNSMNSLKKDFINNKNSKMDFRDPKSLKNNFTTLNLFSKNNSFQIIEKAIWVITT